MKSKIEKICRDAKLIKHRRGELAICLRNLGKNESLLFYHSPISVKRLVCVPYCIATEVEHPPQKEPITSIAYHMLKDCKGRRK